MPQTWGPGPLRDCLQMVLKRQQLEQKLREHAAVTRWPEAVGPANAQHSEAERVVAGVLQVTAASSSWAQALQMMKPQILARLAELVGPGVVHDVRFSAVRRRRRHAVPAAPEAPLRRPAGGTLAAIPLSPEEGARAAALQEDSADPDLGRLLARGYAGLTRLRHYREDQGWRRCPRCGRPHHGPARWCVVCSGAVGRR